MKPEYDYISSIEFITNFDFEYIETYSMQRGTKFGEKSKLELNQLEKLKKFQQKRDLTELEEIELRNLDKLYGSTQYLISLDGEFHPSAEKTGTFKKDSEIVEKLIQILKTPIDEIPSWMCAPVYRDIIVFYDSKNMVLTSLNVCLSCEYMETKKFHYVNADQRTYHLMRDFFIEIGHKMENN